MACLLARLKSKRTYLGHLGTSKKTLWKVLEFKNAWEKSGGNIPQGHNSLVDGTNKFKMCTSEQGEPIPYWDPSHPSIGKDLVATPKFFKDFLVTPLSNVMRLIPFCMVNYSTSNAYVLSSISPIIGWDFKKVCSSEILK